MYHSAADFIKGDIETKDDVWSYRHSHQGFLLDQCNINLYDTSFIFLMGRLCQVDIILTQIF